MDPVAPRSGRRCRQIVRAIVGIAAFVVIVLSCVEIAYQIGLARFPAHSNQRSLPPLVVKSAAVHLLDTANPQMEPIYPWTAVFAVARALLGERPRFTPEQLLADRWLMYPRGLPIWSGVEAAVLATWISRHLSASEAISETLFYMRFGSELGIEQAARHYFGKSPQDLDAEETADLLILGEGLDLRYPDYFRRVRDELLRKLHAYGVIDEPTMAAAMERDVRRFK